MPYLRMLHRSLDERRRPEDVAEWILEVLGGELRRSERRALVKAARGSLRRRFHNYTSMLQDFARPMGLQRQVARALEIFEMQYEITPEQCDDPEIAEDFIRTLSEEIGKEYGRSDFRADRLNRHGRRAAGLDISRRRYNKLFRHLMRMERKLQTYLRELKKLKFTKVGKSGLAHMLSWEAFSKDLNSACFIAYYTARSNLRSEFTIYGQQRPYDEIADMLFQRCRRGDGTNWWAIAQVYPAGETLQHLSDTQKGELIGRWFSLLEEVAILLREVWDRSKIDRETMIVRPGNDSTTWNNTANAWNKARENWIALLYALGMEEALESICFGKVLRLMAADVAAWHRLAGGGLSPDTFVWRELPLPWEVIAGEKTCTLAMVRVACERHGVDPIKAGWIMPRPETRVAKYKPTPELVHGVSVASPGLANLLRQEGVFSGKKKRGPRSLRPDEAEYVHGSVMSEHRRRLTDEQDDLESGSPSG